MKALSIVVKGEMQFGKFIQKWKTHLFAGQLVDAGNGETPEKGHVVDHLEQLLPKVALPEEPTDDGQFWQSHSPGAVLLFEHPNQVL